MITTVDKVLALMDKYPRLTPHGHGAPIGTTTFDEARAEMLTAGFLREVCICRAWLQEATKTQKINPRAGSSYGLKHAVEDTTGQYVCNGAFIMAALLEGFQIGRGFNPCLNIAKRRRPVVPCTTAGGQRAPLTHSPYDPPRPTSSASGAIVG